MGAGQDLPLVTQCPETAFALGKRLIRGSQTITPPRKFLLVYYHPDFEGLMASASARAIVVYEKLKPRPVAVGLCRAVELATIGQ